MTVAHCLRRAGSLASVALSLALSTGGCVGGDAPDDPYATAGKGGSAASAGTGGGAMPKGGSGGGGTGGGGSPAAGTGGSDPEGGSGGSGGSSTPEPGAKDSHYPLIDGATWVYHHEYPQNPGRMPWDEIANMRMGTFEDEPAFILEDEEDAQGERSSSTMLIDGTRIFRVYKEVNVNGQLAFTTTYDPGFLRYDEAWADTGDEAQPLSYESLQNCVMASAASKCAAGAMRMEMTTHTFKVVSRSVSVTTKAGTFDTVQIERTNLGDPAIAGDDEVKQYWYARGVGKVRELDLQTLATEELTSYTIP